MVETKKGLKTIRQWFSQDIQEFLSASFLIFLFKVFGAICGFILSVLITRHLSIEDTGIYFLLMSFIAMTTVISQCGLENAITREVAIYHRLKHYQKIKQLKLTAVKITLLFSSLLAIGLLVFKRTVVNLLHVPLDNSYYLLVILPILLSLLAVSTQVFQGLRQTKDYALLNIVVRPLHLILLFTYVFFVEELSVFITLTFLIVSLSLALILARYRWALFLTLKDEQVHGLVLNKQESTIVKSNLTSLLPSMWLASLFAIIMEQGGQFLVGVLSTTQESALYGVALRIAIIISFVVISFNNALSPKYAQLFSLGDLSKLRQLYVKDTVIRTIILTPILLAVIYFANDILLLFGNDYLAAKSALIWLILGYLVNTVTGPTGMLLMMSHKHKIQRNNLFFSVLVLLSCACLSIPDYGAEGAAKAVFLAITTNNLLGLYQVIKSIFSR